MPPKQECEHRAMRGQQCDLPGRHGTRRAGGRDRAGSVSSAESDRSVRCATCLPDAAAAKRRPRSANESVEGNVHRFIVLAKARGLANLPVPDPFDILVKLGNPEKLFRLFRFFRSGKLKRLERVCRCQWQQSGNRSTSSDFHCRTPSRRTRLTPPHDAGCLDRN